MNKVVASFGVVIVGLAVVGCFSQPPPRPADAYATPTMVVSVTPGPDRALSPTKASSSTRVATATAVGIETSIPPTPSPDPADLVATATAIKTGIELPAPGTRVVVPIHILARVGSPGDKVSAELRWKDGTSLKRILSVVAGEDGRGLLLETFGWTTESQPPQPPTQAATLSLRAADGTVLVQQAVTVLANNDPATTEVALYWVGGDNQIYKTTRRVNKTPQIGRATLDELLWGPDAYNLAGFTTALPTADQVLHSPGRESDWGPRVTLRKLNIVDGVANADFSKEMRAFDGGAARVSLLRQQITRTLKQFSTVKDVRISIEGEAAGILQP